MARFFVWAVLILTVSSAGAEDRLFVASVVRTQPSTSAEARRLSPALLALKHGKGILRGTDLRGNPVIAVSEANIAGLKASSAVKEAKEIDSLPDGWKPVKMLKLSYSDSKPTKGELDELGLKLVEDYAKGEWLMVAPKNGVIDGKLAEKLEKFGKATFVTPSSAVQAIPGNEKGAAQPRPRGPSLVATMPPTNDKNWPLWGMENIGAPKAWKKVKKSSIVVAVLDTGVDYTHDDLKGNMWTKNGSHGFDFVDNDNDPMDLHSHGTHCAGTVGAFGNNNLGVVGVNWEIKIMAVRWLDATGSGEVANAIKAIDFAVDNGAQVISSSWFWSEDDVDLQKAINRAHEKKVLFVAAASNFAETLGNNSGDNDKLDTFGRYPSAYPLKNIISVAAIDIANKKAGFSHFGKTTVDIGAPGVGIDSTVLNNAYDNTFSGTSMATPHVAGACALIMAHPDYQNLNHEQVKELVLKNARKIADLDQKCVTNGTLDISFLEAQAASSPPGSEKKKKN